MQKLYELKIFRTDQPYKLRFIDEFNESVRITRKHYDDTGFIPGWAEFVSKCVYHHLYHQVEDEDDDLVTQITIILIALQKAKLIDHAEEKAITSESSRRYK